MKKCRFLVFAAMVMMLCAVVFACGTNAEERLARAAFLCSVYERPPCDPAEVAVFLACGDMVIFFKGSGETAEAIKREASALFGKFTEYLI